MRRFRCALIPIYFVIAGLGLFFAWRVAHSGIAILGATIANLSVVPLYALSYRAVAPFWLGAKDGRVASSIRRRRLADYTSIPIELVVLLISLLPAAAAWLYYDRLPARIPVHWNLMMVPDRWAPKTMGVAALMPALALHLQVFLLLLKRDTVGVKMRLPAQDTNEFLQAKEELLALGLRLLDWTRIFLGAVLASAALMQIFSTIAELRRFAAINGVVLLVGGGSLAIGLTVLFGRWVLLLRRIDTRFESLRDERGNEAQNWYGGMMYYNRRDPAFIIEKLDGLGYTMNLGNRRVLLYLALSLVIPALLIWAGAT